MFCNLVCTVQYLLLHEWELWNCGNLGGFRLWKHDLVFNFIKALTAFEHAASAKLVLI